MASKVKLVEDRYIVLCTVTFHHDMPNHPEPPDKGHPVKANEFKFKNPNKTLGRGRAQRKRGKSTGPGGRQKSSP